MRDAFIQTLSELAERDPKVLLITGDLGFKVFDDYCERFPNQFLNVGIAEQNMTGVATGMALEGWTVFTYSIGNFPTLRCLEQIRNDACYHGANVKVVCIGGGFSYGALGISHHATEDLAILRALPDITVTVPSDLYEVREATKAIYETPGTCYLRLDRAAGSERPTPQFELGKMRRHKEGSEVAFLCCGGVLEEAMIAARLLDDAGYSSSVCSVHTLKPLDQETILATARSVRALFTLEEHTVEGGLGGAVSEVLVESGIALPTFRRLGLRSGFSSLVGSQEYLRQQYGIDGKSIFQEALKILT
ncbi:MAG: hypothetical protein KDD64_08270 [Bdellovibrionales bacterium]|nr:hypothetical protein [Bdellovibrionales bacterium]